MKKLTILAALVMLISAAGFANDKAKEKKVGENAKFKIVAKSEVKYEFIYVSEKAGEVCVTIYDSKGYKVCNNTLEEATAFRRTYDFSNLKPGEYKVVVRNEEGSSNEIISHKLRKKVLKTFVSKIPDTKSLKVHVGAFNHNKPIMVKIYNQDNTLIHNEEIWNKSSFSKVFNLSKSPAEAVSVSIGNDGLTQRFSYSLDRK